MIFDVLLALHVACAVVGFGAVAVSGVYGGTARRVSGRDRAEETRRYFASPGRLEWLVLAVPFLGAGALAARPGSDDFTAVWVLGGAAIWLVSAGLLLWVVRPAERAIRTATSASAPGLPPAQAARADHAVVTAAGRQLLWAGVVCDAGFVIALALMVSQPA
ncbi:MAG: DUF2269 family protein [Acidimicrobiales bacterium]